MLEEKGMAIQRAAWGQGKERQRQPHETEAERSPRTTHKEMLET